VTVQPVLPPVPTEPAGLPSPEGFRAACAQFATGVVAVTASADGVTCGSTVNSFTSLTLDPPQVLVCLARTSTTWSAIERSGAFAVNVLAADQLPVARLLASKEPEKMSRIGTRPGLRGLPLIQGALSWFECDLSEAVPSGTHLVLIGSVLRVRSDAGKAPAVFFRSQLLPGLPAGGSSAGPSAGPAPVAR